MSKRFIRILCIILAFSLIAGIVVSVIVEWPWAGLILALAGAGAFVAYARRNAGNARRQQH